MSTDINLSGTYNAANDEQKKAPNALALAAQEMTGTAPSAQKKPVDMFVCQDASRITREAAAMASFLRKQGHDIEVTTVEDKNELMKKLKERKKDGIAPPTHIFLDVSGGNGSSAALNAINWIEENHPGAPLPEINFLSCDLGMAIDAACTLRSEDARFQASASCTEEQDWIKSYLESAKTVDGKTVYTAPSVKEDKAYTTAFREILNNNLGLEMPLDCAESEYYGRKLRHMNSLSTDQILIQYRRGKASEQEVIERMRGWATTVAESVRTGFYFQDAENGANKLPTDAHFYGAVGFPMKGPVVFNLKDTAYENNPVLIMRNYDPAVVPLLATGQIGGLIVTSTYMASHLKMLCETHMIPGMFGVMPAGQKTMKGEFNEEAQPDGPAFYQEEKISINGKTISKGQEVLLCASGNGLVCKPPAEMQAEAINMDSIQKNIRIMNDLKNLRTVSECLRKELKAQGDAPCGIKANVDRADGAQVELTENIGLVRTEQLVAGSSYTRRYLRNYLLADPKEDPKKENFNSLCYDISGSVGYFLRRLAKGQSVKVRLFDFVYSEILDKKDHEAFIAKYNKLDIHGGEALAKFPDLYRGEVEAIFGILARRAKSAAEDGTPFTIPLEIMMPAVRTKEDVLVIKEIIEKAAEKTGIKPEQYRFGVMVETLDSCKNIEDIAPLCDFISFGTNDLTQQYTGISRSDLNGHAKYKREHGIDPFKTLAPGVMSLVCDVTERARRVKPGMKVDICGAQAADLDTAMALYASGIDNISVAPTISNLYSLPVLLNYRKYDALQKTKEATAEATTATATKQQQKPAA